MTTHSGPAARTPERRGGRPVAAMVVTLVGLTGISACGDSAGPEAGVTVEDLQDVESRIDALDERVGVLEESGAVPEDLDDEPPEALPDFFKDADVFVGQQVTVSGEVTDVLTATDAGTAFRIAGEVGDPITVVTTMPPQDLSIEDVIRVSGQVLVLRRDTFEQEFGVAADQLFEHPDGFFDEAEDQIAIAAEQVDVLPEQDG